MSYDQIKDTGARPLYVQQREAAGYQGANGANNLQHYSSPLPQVDHDQDVENDPSSLPVAHLNLDFKECFREHESTKTVAAYYEVLGLIYKYVKFFTYHTFVLLFGVFFVIAYAIFNGVLSFFHVWIYGPTAKMLLVGVYALAPLVVAPFCAMYRPLVDVHARIFRQIRIRISKPTPNQTSNI